ncbi:MAG TPA: lipid-A-disaccharide synthase [Vicinamibacterales bacterium]
MASVFISCGEPSGDLYAAALIEQLRSLDPDLRAMGFGGERFQAAGATLVGDYRGLAVTGLVEAIRVLPRSLEMYRRLVRAAREQRPDVFVAIDFPDFNFRLAGAIRRLGIPIVYYIPPQLWAWRSGRMRTLSALADRILVIFPFEPEVYRAAGTPVTFVGHPLVELTSAACPREAFLAGLGLDPRRPTLAVLPGSRPNEVREILPTVVAALPRIALRVPGLQVVVARAPALTDDLFSPLGTLTIPVTVVERRTDDVLASADAVITASGTATVQAAIHECPMVIVYRVAPLTYAIGRRFVHVDTFGMVNLVAGERVALELIQDGFTADAVAGEAVRLLTDSDARQRAVAALREVRARLGGRGASRRAAEIVLETARSHARCTHAHSS